MYETKQCFKSSLRVSTPLRRQQSIFRILWSNERSICFPTPFFQLILLDLAKSKTEQDSDNSRVLPFWGRNRHYDPSHITVWYLRAITWSPTEQAVCCDECSMWYQGSCLEMCAKGYSLLQHSNVQWVCCRCHTLNVSSFTFRSIKMSPSFHAPIANENNF